MSPLRLRFTPVLATVAAAGVLFLAAAPCLAREAFRREVLLALSAQDKDLIRAISSLGPQVRPDEAARVAECAYTTGRDLRKKWRVVWPPGLQNFLVHNGSREGGLCFQFAEELLVRLYLLKLESVQLHWAESYQATASEHNVIVVTAIGQPFSQGVFLDNWRFGGKLAWGWVPRDPEYKWTENPQHYAYLVNNKFRARTHPAANKPLNPAAPGRPTEAQQSAPRSGQHL